MATDWSEALAALKAAPDLDLTSLTADGVNSWFHRQDESHQNALLAKLDEDVEHAKSRGEAGEVILASLQIFRSLLVG